MQEKRTFLIAFCESQSFSLSSFVELRDYIGWSDYPEKVFLRLETIPNIPVAEQMAKKAQKDVERVKEEAIQVIERARAEAESLKLQREAVSPQLIELRKVEAQIKAIAKWNGVLPQYTGSGPVPFINVK